MESALAATIITITTTATATASTGPAATLATSLPLQEERVGLYGAAVVLGAIIALVGLCFGPYGRAGYS
ncbi:hypothetical protein H109_00342, partial [Trichophyton interdigitale MR816]